MVKTPFGIPLLMMPLLIPCMPVILPAWAWYTAVMGGDKPMSKKKFTRIISGMFCIFIINFIASKVPMITIFPPIMIGLLVLKCWCCCSCLSLLVDLKKRITGLTGGDKSKPDPKAKAKAKAK